MLRRTYLAKRVFGFNLRATVQPSKRMYSDNTIRPGTYTEAIQACANNVRKLDYPHYFTSLFQPKELQISTMSLRAFNIEIASIKSSQSTELAELKMKWWKDAIDTIYKGEVVNHPVLLILKEVIERNKLSKTWFLKILDARSKDLRVTQPSHLSDIEDYAEATYSSLLYLALESAGLRNIDADHAASHLGKAFGMVTILRAIPYQLKHQHIDVPKDMMIKHKFSAEQLLRGDMTSEGRNVIYEVADIANQHIELARSMKDQVPSAAKIVFLPTEFYASYLNQLKDVDFDPFHPRLKAYSILTRPRVVKNYFTKTF